MVVDPEDGIVGGAAEFRVDDWALLPGLGEEGRARLFRLSGLERAMNEVR